MNSFGRIFRATIWGESHGFGVGVIIDGCPAGIELSVEDFLQDLDRRRAGAKGTTPRKETDIPKIQSGIFNGKTTGAPILITFENQDVDSSAYESIKNTPRPGHADMTALHKFGGFHDYRGSGHFSGRLTAAVVAAGVIAKKAIFPLSPVATITHIKDTKINSTADKDKIIDEALARGDSVGGIVECTVKNMPTGLGEPFFDSLESMIAHAVFAIPATKGIEFGSGFASATLWGSECNDEIAEIKGTTYTNNSGGINGGISNGNSLVFRVAVKPTSSIKVTKQTVDLNTGLQTTISVPGRHDACIALRVPPVLEAMTALVLADSLLIEQGIKRVKV